MAPMNWSEAPCIGKNPDWFFPPEDVYGDQRRALYALALDVCARCPMRAPCLALAPPSFNSADCGVWGGTTPQMRRKAVRDRLVRRAS